MEAFRDPTGPARAATVALYLYMVLTALVALLRLGDPNPGSAADLVSIPAFFVLIACFILVGRWIYRTNANAHLLGSGMTISPGWSIGWFFVPIANLVQPYVGVKETWRASHDAGGLHEEAETALLPWWWGLWLLTNILSNIVVMFGGDFESPTPTGIIYLDLFVAALNVPLCLILIRLMRRLARVQVLAVQASAFA